LEETREERVKFSVDPNLILLMAKCCKEKVLFSDLSSVAVLCGTDYTARLYLCEEGFPAGFGSKRIQRAATGSPGQYDCVRRGIRLSVRLS
jgi:hypothetical protein